MVYVEGGDNNNQEQELHKQDHIFEFPENLTENSITTKDSVTIPLGDPPEKTT